MPIFKLMNLTEAHVRVITDALRAYVALRTEEYHDNPTLAKARAMDEANEALDLFLSREGEHIVK